MGTWWDWIGDGLTEVSSCVSREGVEVGERLIGSVFCFWRGELEGVLLSGFHPPDSMMGLVSFGRILTLSLSGLVALGAVWGPTECCSRRLRRSSRMSEREGREGEMLPKEGEGGRVMVEREASGEEERMLWRDGDGRRNRKNRRAFVILLGFHRLC